MVSLKYREKGLRVEGSVRLALPASRVAWVKAPPHRLSVLIFANKRTQHSFQLCCLCSKQLGIFIYF